MTPLRQQAPPDSRTEPAAWTEPVTWTEPAGLNPRGTLIVIPGRGESPDVYERFGRRIASDAYRVQVVTNPVEDATRTEEQVRSALDGPAPVVLVGSDTGALFAAGLVASGRLPEADALVLAGLPADPGPADPGPADPGPADPGPADPDPAADASAGSWDDELAARTSCPTHRGRLAGPALRRGALYEPVPEGWTELADLRAVTVPILGLHGAADPVSPLRAARARYAAAPRAELFSVTDGRHDALNDITHRTAAATVIVFLERLRLGADLPPIAVRESL